MFLILSALFVVLVAVRFRRLINKIILTWKLPGPLALPIVGNGVTLITMNPVGKDIVSITLKSIKLKIELIILLL